CGLDVFSSGHVHNYQRTRPLRFLAKPAPDRTFKSGGTYAIAGDFEIDETFDGVSDTTPDGVLYIVTGAGGAGAYDPDQTDNQPSWQGYTAKFGTDAYSVTTVHADGATLTMRQISETGAELDRIVLTKRSRLVGQETPNSR